MLGVEHLEYYNHKFDFIFMLGVLYHRPDPVGTLKSLARGLNSKGEILIDTFMIDGDEELCLTPNKRYSKFQISILSQQFQHLKIGLKEQGLKILKFLQLRLQLLKNKEKLPGHLIKV